MVVEADPNGIDQHSPGAKLDAGKPRVAFALSQFFRALSLVDGVSRYGANKYTPNGWRDVPDGEERYMEALLRHLAAHRGGEVYDKDTQLLHCAHLAWNALAVLEFVCKNHSSQLIPTIEEITTKALVTQEKVSEHYYSGERIKVGKASREK